MRSKYINSTSHRKYLTENGFSYIDFLYDIKKFSRPTLLFAYFGDFSLSMRSTVTYINSTSCRKFVTGNGLSDPDFL